MTDSSVQSGLMRFFGIDHFPTVHDRTPSPAHPHDGADPCGHASPNATLCSSQPPGYLVLQPFGTDVVRDLREVYPTPFSWLATQWSHPCDVTVRILPVQYPVNETREGCPDSFPPNLNKRRGPNTVRAPSQVPHESAYICQLCSFYPHPSLIVFSVSQAGRLTVQDVALSITMHPSRVSSPSTTSFSHFKESPTVGLCRRQSYSSLAAYHLQAHEISQFRLSFTSPFGSLPSETSL